MSQGKRVPLRRSRVCRTSKPPRVSARFLPPVRATKREDLKRVA